MTTQQPEALRLATASNAMADEGEMIHLLSWHEIRNLLRANAAELRRQHARIAELQARIKTMAEEHADELMVAHMDGRMRAEQPTTQTAPAAVAWRELCRRLYVELFHCDKQMTSGKRPKWQQGKTVRDVLADAKAALDAAPQPSTTSQGDALDAARLDWLLLHISGAEFRRIGVHYSGNARRADVDTARKQGANHD